MLYIKTIALQIIDSISILVRIIGCISSYYTLVMGQIWLLIALAILGMLY